MEISISTLVPWQYHPLCLLAGSTLINLLVVPGSGPAIIERFCAEDDGNETMMLHSNLVDGRDAGTFPHLDNQTDKPPVSHNQGSSVVKTVEKSKMAVRSAPHQSYYTELSKVKVVEALTECLKYNGNCAQVSPFRFVSTKIMSSLNLSSKARSVVYAMRKNCLKE